MSNNFYIESKNIIKILTKLKLKDRKRFFSIKRELKIKAGR